MAHALLKSSGDGRSEAVERRAKAHLGREDPIAEFGWTDFLVIGTTRRLSSRGAPKWNDEQGLINRLGDDDGRAIDGKSLNGRTTTHGVAAVTASASVAFPRGAVLVMVRICSLLVRFNFLVMMSGIVRMTILRHGYGIVIMGGRCMTHSCAVVRAGADPLRSAQRDAHDPDEHAQRGPYAEAHAGLRLS